MSNGDLLICLSPGGEVEVGDEDVGTVLTESGIPDVPIRRRRYHAHLDDWFAWLNERDNAPKYALWRVIREILQHNRQAAEASEAHLGAVEDMEAAVSVHISDEGELGKPPGWQESHGEGFHELVFPVSGLHGSMEQRARQYVESIRPSVWPANGIQNPFQRRYRRLPYPWQVRISAWLMEGLALSAVGNVFLRSSLTDPWSPLYLDALLDPLEHAGTHTLVRRPTDAEADQFFAEDGTLRDRHARRALAEISAALQPFLAAQDRAAGKPERLGRATVLTISRLYGFDELVPEPDAELGVTSYEQLLANLADESVPTGERLRQVATLIDKYWGVLDEQPAGMAAEMLSSYLLFGSAARAAAGLAEFVHDPELEHLVHAGADVLKTANHLHDAAEIFERSTATTQEPAVRRASRRQLARRTLGVVTAVYDVYTSIDDTQSAYRAGNYEQLTGHALQVTGAAGTVAASSWKAAAALGLAKAGPPGWITLAGAALVFGGWWLVASVRKPPLTLWLERTYFGTRWPESTGIYEDPDNQQFRWRDDDEVVRYGRQVSEFVSMLYPLGLPDAKVQDGLEPPSGESGTVAWSFFQDDEAFYFKLEPELAYADSQLRLRAYNSDGRELSFHGHPLSGGTISPHVKASHFFTLHRQNNAHHDYRYEYATLQDLQGSDDNPIHFDHPNPWFQVNTSVSDDGVVQHCFCFFKIKRNNSEYGIPYDPDTDDEDEQTAYVELEVLLSNHTEELFDIVVDSTAENPTLQDPGNPKGEMYLLLVDLDSPDALSTDPDANWWESRLEVLFDKHGVLLAGPVEKLVEWPGMRWILTDRDSQTSYLVARQQVTTKPLRHRWGLRVFQLEIGPHEVEDFPQTLRRRHEFAWPPEDAG